MRDLITYIKHVKLSKRVTYKVLITKEAGWENIQIHDLRLYIVLPRRVRNHSVTDAQGQGLPENKLGGYPGPPPWYRNTLSFLITGAGFGKQKWEINRLCTNECLIFHTYFHRDMISTGAGLA